MSSAKILHGRAFIGGLIEDDTLVSIDESGRIVEARPRSHAAAGAEHFDGVLVPGFIDVHVHGGDGADFMDADDDAIRRVTTFHARNGTTSLAATTLSASRHDLHDAVSAIGRVSRGRPSGAQIVGVHLEGPYISPEKSGAQDRESIRLPDIHEIAALVAEAPHLKWIITIAPEVEGARSLMERFEERITFSIGHTSADYGQCIAAMTWGASHMTHLFNAMTPLQHRAPGAVGAALTSSDVTVELIADGVHVHPAVLRFAASSMPNRTALITDAIRACGLADGTYKLYGYDVTVADGAARLADGTLAGSVLTMARAVQNMVELAGVPLQNVLPLATEVPARILGLGNQKGRIEAGFDADLVILSERFEVERVFVRGHAIA
jgi:N-acetylglucosamine-6-phosphate deacetylase